MKERTIFALVVVTLVLLGLGYLTATRLDVLPEAASSRALLVDQLFRVMLGIAAVIFFLVEGALIYAVIRFRQPPEDDSDAVPVHENLPLELTWTLIPALIVIVIGVYSFRVLTRVEAAPPDALVVEVIARQFSWEFRYPEAGVSSQELHLPVGRPVRFQITSEDVIHSFWVPAFRAKQDATPGQVSELVITPVEEGRFPIRCAELCGVGHAIMTSEVVVESEAEFEAWLESLTSLPSDPVEAGRFVFEKYGCGACHTLADAGGAGIVGPTLEGIATTAAGRIPGVDARTYIEQSIVDPGAFVVEGFPDGVMPRDFGERMSDAELEAIVNYLLMQE